MVDVKADDDVVGDRMGDDEEEPMPDDEEVEMALCFIIMGFLVGVLIGDCW